MTVIEKTDGDTPDNKSLQTLEDEECIVDRRNPMKRAFVTIYTRPGCHLCDEAKTVIKTSGCSDEFSLEEINIDQDESLRERYGNDVPVILINGVKAFKHRVDPAEFKRKLHRMSG